MGGDRCYPNTLRYCFAVGTNTKSWCCTPYKHNIICQLYLCKTGGKEYKKEIDQRMNFSHQERAGGDHEIHTYCRGKPTFSGEEEHVRQLASSLAGENQYNCLRTGINSLHCFQETHYWLQCWCYYSPSAGYIMLDITTEYDSWPPYCVRKVLVEELWKTQ